MELNLSFGVNCNGQLDQAWQRSSADDVLRDINPLEPKETRTIPAKPGFEISSLYASSQGGDVRISVSGREFAVNGRPLQFARDGHFQVAEFNGEAPQLVITNATEQTVRTFRLVVGYRAIPAPVAAEAVGSDDARAASEVATVPSAEGGDEKPKTKGKTKSAA